MALWLFVLVGLSVLGCGISREIAPARHGSEDGASRFTLAIVMAYVVRDIENAAFRCIDTALREEFPEIHIIPPEEFRPAAFPELPPEAAIHDPEYLALALHHPKFRARVNSLGIRYLVALRGVTEQKLVGAGAGGVAGLIVWNRNTRLAASILEVAKSEKPTEVEATASGNPWLLLLGGVPLVVPAATEATACDGLGKAVVKFLLDAPTTVQ